MSHLDDADPHGPHHHGHHALHVVAALARHKHRRDAGVGVAGRLGHDDQRLVHVVIHNGSAGARSLGVADLCRCHSQSAGL